MRFVLVLVILALAACAAPAPRSGDILALGDSVMTWNRSTGRAIPDVVARSTGRAVTRAAMPGARISHPTALGRGLGLDISRQWDDGRWSDVIVVGGANDLRSECGCGACASTLDRLITPEGQGGEIPALAARIRATGARLTLIGYYGPIRGGGGGSDACSDELAALDTRLARLAADDPGIAFVPTRTAFDGAPALYAPDRVHPSPAGSERIGALVAAALASRGMPR